MTKGARTSICEDFDNSLYQALSQSTKKGICQVMTLSLLPQYYFQILHKFNSCEGNVILSCFILFPSENT